MHVLIRFLASPVFYFVRKYIDKQGCQTKYPILLLHGIAFRDDMFFRSWGNVKKYLEYAGAKVYLGGGEAWATFDTNAKLLEEKINDILQETGAEKVNIVAHSKGGLDARYAISQLNLGNKVASLTTVSTPHHGTSVADVITGVLPDKNAIAYKLVNEVGQMMGDESADSFASGSALSRPAMEKFNQENLDDPKVFYQSYGATISNPAMDLLFSLSYVITKENEGDNDGMVSVNSAKWGEFHNDDILSNVSHLQITGSVFDIILGKNIPLKYVGWVHQLKERGF